jgi:hypothetical protein
MVEGFVDDDEDLRRLTGGLIRCVLGTGHEGAKAICEPLRKLLESC